MDVNYQKCKVLVLISCILYRERFLRAFSRLKIQYDKYQAALTRRRAPKHACPQCLSTFIHPNDIYILLFLNKVD